MIAKKDRVRSTHSSVEYNKQERVLFSPWRQFGIVNSLSIILLDAEVNVCRIFQKPKVFSKNECLVHREQNFTYSGHVKNSGISSRTSPRVSVAAESYALATSLHST